MKVDAVQAREARELVVHHRRGVEHIRLTGDEKLDELLRRFAAKGGFVTEQQQPSENEEQ